MQQNSEDWKYEETVNKAIDNIAMNIKDVNNAYGHAIASYALQLANHPMKDVALDSLINKSQSKGMFTHNTYTYALCHI